MKEAIGWGDIDPADIVRLYTALKTIKDLALSWKHSKGFVDAEMEL
jgi:hypothetical protein